MLILERHVAIFQSCDLFTVVLGVKVSNEIMWFVTKLWKRQLEKLYKGRDHCDHTWKWCLNLNALFSYEGCAIDRFTSWFLRSADHWCYILTSVMCILLKAASHTSQIWVTQTRYFTKVDSRVQQKKSIKLTELWDRIVRGQFLFFLKFLTQVPKNQH